MIRQWSLSAWVVGASCFAMGLSVARAEEKPLEGDMLNGGRQYRLHCAACHGLAADGDGPLAPSLRPHPSSLRDGGFVWSHSDEDIANMVLKGTNLPAGAPPHGRGLTSLDMHDMLVWLKAPVPEVGAFFSTAAEYIAHKQTIDEFGLERAEKVLSEPLDASEKSVVVFTMFKADEGATNTTPGHATRIPEDMSELLKAKPARKLGFVAYLPLDVDGGHLEVALALNRNMKLISVLPLPGSDEKNEKLRQKLEPLLRSYVGSGGRDDKKPVEPQKGGKAPKDVQKAMLKAFTRILEGAAMYEKEEKERYWADPEAMKAPAAEEQQPEDVKFEFKESKVKKAK